MSLTSSVLRVHEWVYVKTDGLVGHRMIGVPTLLLRTTGAKSGAQRVNALVYALDGKDYLVVASNGGADQAPGWLFNIRAEPQIEIQVGRERRPATAREVKRDDPDYERLWRIVNDNNRDRYNGYQKKTRRQIPIVALTPR